MSPFIPNFRNTTTYDNQGSMNNIISVNLKINIFSSVIYRCKTVKIPNPIPAAETSIPVLVIIAKKRPFTKAGIKKK